jgi:hypothetical protein
MTGPRYISCPNCGEHRDTSGRYTSPANNELDQRSWAEDHLSGNCLSAAVVDKHDVASSTNL